jgi:TRAP-type C4-dicarboxylate transport system substrate-binding protein
MVQWFKSNGFEPRAMAMTDIMTGLTTGMVDAVPTTPLAALLFQWYKQTPNMLDIGLAPVVGATIVTRKAWNAIPAMDKPGLLASAAAVQKRLQEEVPKQETASVAEMTRRGLIVTKASGPEWSKEADLLATTMRGEMVPKDMFDLALKARDAYRKQHPSQPGK